VKGPDGDGMYTVEMEGVDVYDPVNNSVVDTGTAKVAAWFVDGDYDGRTFCITQAFFPNRSAWEKLSKALAGVMDPERFELFDFRPDCRASFHYFVSGFWQDRWDGYFPFCESRASLASSALYP
jgi:hypothetical protein